MPNEYVFMKRLNRLKFIKLQHRIYNKFYVFVTVYGFIFKVIYNFNFFTMKKKTNFTKYGLMGALFCGLASPTFVGCQEDFETDIEVLQGELNDLKTGFDALKKLVDEGEVISKVEPIEGGFKVIFKNGGSYTITNGKDGAQGEQGATGPQGPQGEQGETGPAGPAGETTTTPIVVEIDDEGYLTVNDERIGNGPVVNVDQPTPTITIVDGYIYINGEKQEGAALPKDIPTAVDNGDYIVFTIDGKETKVWKNATLSGLLTRGVLVPKYGGRTILFPMIYGENKAGEYVQLFAGDVDVVYDVNPKSATFSNIEFIQDLIETRTAPSSLPTIIANSGNKEGILTVTARAYNTNLCNFKYLNLPGAQYHKGELIKKEQDILALQAQCQNETFTSDYVVAAIDDYSNKNVSVRNIHDTTNDVLATDAEDLKRKDADPMFTLIYNDGKGELNLRDSLSAYLTRQLDKIYLNKLADLGFVGEVYEFEKETYEFTDGTETDYHEKYINLSEEGVVSINEAANEKGSALEKTPIIKVTLKSPAKDNYNAVVTTAYVKLIIAKEQVEEVKPEVPVFEETVNYVLNLTGKAQSLRMDPILGHVNDALKTTLSMSELHAIYTQFTQEKNESGIKLFLTRETETGNAEWLKVAVPNYLQAGTYTVTGTFTSTTPAVYPDVTIEYTVNVTYPEDNAYITKRTDVGDGGHFWEEGVLMINGKINENNVFVATGVIANAFNYALPGYADPWGMWDETATEKVNIWFDVVDDLLTQVSISDTDSDVTTWKGNIETTSIEDEYLDAEIQPLRYFNLGVKKMVNAMATQPDATIAYVDELWATTTPKFTVRFVSPIGKLACSATHALDKNNTSTDQTVDILSQLRLTDKDDAVLYADKAFQTVQNTQNNTADNVYSIKAPAFEWADEASAKFAADMSQRVGGKCAIDAATGVLTYCGSGEVGAVDLKVKATMTSTWGTRTTICTVQVK